MCKAGEERKYSVTPKTQFLTNNPKKSEKVKIVKGKTRERESSFGQQERIGPALKIRHTHTFKYRVTEIVS